MLHAETYSIEFASGSGSSDSYKRDSLTADLFTASSSAIVDSAVMVNVFAGKNGYGRKLGTASDGGSISLQLDKTYFPTQITVYAASYKHKNDTAANKGFKMNGEMTTWRSNKIAIQAYTFAITSGINRITIASADPTYNRFYIQRVVFSSDSSSLQSGTATDSIDNGLPYECMQISVAPGNYYESAEGLADAALKTALSERINCGVRYVYGSGVHHTWDAFFHTDRDTLTNQVLDMYSNTPRYFNPSAPTASVSDMDIEHMFPKSWWGGEENMAYSDLYHLVPADYSANRSKSNYAPGYVVNAAFDNGSFLRGSNSAYPVSSVFCPAAEYRGDFARAYFYIATCYEDFTWDAPSIMDNSSYLEFCSWLQAVLLDWHRQDPVSEKEKSRAIAVNAIQGNRNPFIDYPELVEYIWGNKQHTAVTFSTLTSPFDSVATDCTATSLRSSITSSASRLILRDGRLYILRDGRIYSISGVLVE